MGHTLCSCWLNLHTTGTCPFCGVLPCRWWRAWSNRAVFPWPCLGWRNLQLSCWFLNWGDSTTQIYPIDWRLEESKNGESYGIPTCGICLAMSCHVWPMKDASDWPASSADSAGFSKDLAIQLGISWNGGTPVAGWCLQWNIHENPTKMDDLGVHPFVETWNPPQKCCDFGEFLISFLLRSRQWRLMTRPASGGKFVKWQWVKTGDPFNHWETAMFCVYPAVIKHG